MNFDIKTNSKFKKSWNNHLISYIDNDQSQFTQSPSKISKILRNEIEPNTYNKQKQKITNNSAYEMKAKYQIRKSTFSETEEGSVRWTFVSCEKNETDDVKRIDEIKQRVEVCSSEVLINMRQKMRTGTADLQEKLRSFSLKTETETRNLLMKALDNIEKMNQLRDIEHLNDPNDKVPECVLECLSVKLDQILDAMVVILRGCLKTAREALSSPLQLGKTGLEIAANVLRLSLFPFDDCELWSLNEMRN